MKLTIKDLCSTLLKGILAGISISIGGIIYIKAKEQTILSLFPAFLFPIGLILICCFDFFLYTGRICYFTKSFKDKTVLPTSITLLVGLLGNFIGTLILGVFLHFALEPTTIVNKMIETKLNYEWWRLVILGMGCGMLIYFAVEGFKKIQSNLGKYLVLILCISGFIICGFEHCIADMFYFIYSFTFSLKAFTTILFVILGNSLGGIVIYLLHMCAIKFTRI